MQLTQSCAESLHATEDNESLNTTKGKENVNAITTEGKENAMPLSYVESINTVEGGENANATEFYVGLNFL